MKEIINKANLRIASGDSHAHAFPSVSTSSDYVDLMLLCSYKCLSIREEHLWFVVRAARKIKPIANDFCPKKNERYLALIKLSTKKITLLT